MMWLQKRRVLGKHIWRGIPSSERKASLLLLSLWWDFMQNVGYNFRHSRLRNIVQNRATKPMMTVKGSMQALQKMENLLLGINYSEE